MAPRKDSVRRDDWCENVTGDIIISSQNWKEEIKRAAPPATSRLTRYSIIIISVLVLEKLKLKRALLFLLRTVSRRMILRTRCIFFGKGCCMFKTFRCCVFVYVECGRWGNYHVQRCVWLWARNIYQGWLQILRNDAALLLRLFAR